MPGKSLLIFIMINIFATVVLANDKNYAPASVIYDVTSGNIETVKHTLDRASLLQNIYNSDPFNASIIIVIHDEAIPLFTKNKTLIQRSKDLTMAEVIQFRLCKASARLQGYTKNDFENFITMVPMADAEIIELQNEGYSYLR